MCQSSEERQWKKQGSMELRWSCVRHLKTHPSYIGMAQRENACQYAHAQAQQQRHRRLTQPIALLFLQPLPQAERQSQQHQLAIKRVVRRSPARACVMYALMHNACDVANVLDLASAYLCEHGSACAHCIVRVRGCCLCNQ